MASSSDVKAGGAYVEMYARGHQAVQKVLDTVRAKMVSMARTVAIIGAATAGLGAMITAPFYKGLDIYAETAAEISGVARQTDFTREQVSGLMYAMGDAAASLPAATNDIARFIEAAHTSPEAMQTLAELGLSLDELASASRYEQLMMIADALSRITNDTRRAQLQARLGGGVAALGPRLREGRAGIDARIDRGRVLGAVRSEDELKELEEYNKAKKEMNVAWTGLFQSIGAAAAPVMMKIYQFITGVIVAVRELIDANKPLLSMLFRFGAILLVAGPTIVAIAGGLFTMAAGLGLIGVAMPFVIIGLKIAAIAIVAIIGLGLQAYIAFKIVEGVLRLFGTTIDEVFSSMSGYFSNMIGAAQRLGATLSTMFGGVVDAIMGGDIELAFRIVSLGVQLIWARTVNFLRDGWFSAVLIMGGVWDTFATAIKTAFNSVSATVIEIFHTIAATASSIFARIVTEIAVLFDNLIDKLPSSIREQLGLTVLGEGSIRTAALEEEGRRESQQTADWFDRQAATVNRQMEIDAQPAMNEESRRNAYNDERERANTEERGLSDQLDEGALDAWIAAEQRRIQGWMPGGGDPFELERGISVQGTFNAAAVAGFAGGGVSNAERIAESSRAELTRVRELLARIAERDGAAMG